MGSWTSVLIFKVPKFSVSFFERLLHFGFYTCCQLLLFVCLLYNAVLVVSSFLSQITLKARLAVVNLSGYVTEWPELVPHPTHL